MSISSILSSQIWIDPPSGEIPAGLKTDLQLPDLVLRILSRQGINIAADARAFMDFRFYTPSSPYDFPDMEKSVERVLRAVKSGELIGVWGDFDVDGQTSTAVLISTLRKVGAKVTHHIPVRGPESHGIKLDVLKDFIKQGITLIITCDTGISEIDSVAWAQSQNVDVIITDHHTLPEILPTSFAIINPQLLDPKHPMRALPGVGVAYKFSQALLEKIGFEDHVENLHDLAALGIIADVAELRADARFLVQSGINLIRHATRPSILAILQAAEIDPELLSEESISFSLAPRLNAIGRLSDANPIVNFLLSENPAEIAVTINQLEGLNARRKLLCDQVFQGAQDQIQRNPGLLDHPVLMMMHPEWPAGVVGIVASRLVSFYKRPVLLFVSPPGDLMRGSARSIEGINITAAIRSQSSLLSSFGGHPMAAGLSLDPDHFKQFQRQMDGFIESELVKKPIVNVLQIDSWQQPSSIDLNLLQELDRLAPFGQGNPPVVFAAKGMRLVGSTPVGKTREHAQMILEDDQEQTVRMIWWQSSGMPQPDGIFDLAYAARASTYKGLPQVQLEWLDFRLHDSETINLSTDKQQKVFEIIDYRHEKDTVPILEKFCREFSPAIYQEGSDPFSAVGQSRETIALSKTLVLWTIPPSQSVLERLIYKVNPEKIIFFGILPNENELDHYLKSIARVIKQDLSQSQVKIDINKLASKFATNSDLVEETLRWFSARGDLTIVENDNDLFIKSGGKIDLAAKEEIQFKLNRMIAEIQSYRRYYLKSDIKLLLSRN